MLLELHHRLTPVRKHREFSDEEIFSYRNGRGPVDVPAGGRPVCPNDQHGDCARGRATGSATAATSTARRHDGAGDNGPRDRTRGSTPGNSTPGDRTGGFPVTGAGCNHDDIDLDFDRQG
jgi:hypothetical protein